MGVKDLGGPLVCPFGLTQEGARWLLGGDRSAFWEACYVGDSLGAQRHSVVAIGALVCACARVSLLPLWTWQELEGEETVVSTANLCAAAPGVLVPFLHVRMCVGIWSGGLEA